MKRKKTIKPFGLRAEPILQESAISVTRVHKSILPQIPPSIINKHQVILQLNKLPETKTHPSTYVERFDTILPHHLDHQYIFTDGSKDSNKTAYAAVLNETTHNRALPMKSSIFTAEVCAMDLALGIISRDKHEFIIFSDLLSVLTSLRNKKLKNPLIVKLLCRLVSMSSHNEIIMRWITSHIRVSGNKRADSAAKSALDLSADNISILYTDLKPTISKFLFTKWKQRWNNNIHNKLFQIQPTLREWRPALR